MENGNGHGINYSELLKPDAIHGRLLYDPEIFEDEMEKLFGRTWMYIGHESEVPRPGDFVSRKLGLQPVILVRGKDMKVRLFYNRCRHRANTVCLAEHGSSPGGFRCIYHGWTYAPSGELVGVPYPEGFDPRDFNKADYGLAEIPMDSYRGLVFGNRTPAEDLKTFLGVNVRRVIDQQLDLAPEGEIVVSKYHLKGKYYGNWKFGMDNTVDSYHGIFLHETVVALGRAVESDDVDKGFGIRDLHRQRDLGHGHAHSDHSGHTRHTGGFFAQPFNKPIPAEDQRAYVEALTRRLGKERAQELLEIGDPGPLTIFPTVSLVPSEIRLLQPVGPYETEVYYYPVLLKGAPRSLNAVRTRMESFIHGPAGVVTSDDVSVFERAQEAVRASHPQWIVLKAGLHQEEQEEEGAVGRVHYETSNRALWREYGKRMTA